MREYRKISKLEEINSIKKTLQHNELALDYIQNQIYRTENSLKIDPSDKGLEEQLNSEKYIKFSLEYLDRCYSDRLKKLGVRL